MKNKLSINLMLLLMGASFVLMTSCRSIPKSATVIKDFDASKYVGTWYEIARIDFKHERNLNNTAAQYSLKDNGDIKVVNSGFNYLKNEWTQREGNAKFRGAKNIGALKVSFFGPFYSGYNIYALDKEYKYVLIGGKNYDYLWILSREKSIPNHVKQHYLRIASNFGYNVNDLLWVEHDKNNPYLQ